MRKLQTLLTGLLLVTASGLAAAAQQAAPEQGHPLSHQQLLEAGKQIYLYGKLPSGTLIRAKVRQDVPLQGSRYACANCHRRSGIGSSEGGDLIPPIVGSSIFAPRTAALHTQYPTGSMYQQTRPAYTTESLGRALRKGIDPTGRELDVLMPRFVLTDEEVLAISTYLGSLTVTLPPGVTDEKIHFATITTAGVEADRRAVLDVLNTFFRDKNARTRNEIRRAEHSPFHKEWFYKSYRTWELHEWHLEGPERSWPGQLRRLYAEQPVFIVLGGVGHGNWEGIHRFCEEQGLPCLLPSIAQPPSGADEDFYSIYFSRGVELEAEALAKRLAKGPRETGKVLQIRRETPASHAAAAALRRALPETTTLTDVVLGEGEAASAEFWQSLAAEHHDSSWVLWLKHTDLAELEALASSSSLQPVTIYLSATLQGDIGALLQHPLHHRFTLLSPYRPPGIEHNTVNRFRTWAQLRKIQNDSLHLHLQSASFFAATLAGESLMHMHGNFSREYFIERIEHMMDNMINPSLYSHLSLAPGQRFAVKGCYVWEMGKNFDTAQWVVP